MHGWQLCCGWHCYSDGGLTPPGACGARPAQRARARGRPRAPCARAPRAPGAASRARPPLRARPRAPPPCASRAPSPGSPATSINQLAELSLLRMDSSGQLHLDHDSCSSASRFSRSFATLSCHRCLPAYVACQCLKVVSCTCTVQPAPLPCNSPAPFQELSAILDSLLIGLAPLCVTARHSHICL